MNAEHGTNALYKLGCRCRECVTYQRDRVRANRADRLAAGRLNHGKRSAYDAGCRCPECKAVRSAATAKERGQRRRIALQPRGAS